MLTASAFTQIFIGCRFTLKISASCVQYCRRRVQNGMDLFSSTKVLAGIMAGLRQLGYDESLLIEDYGFRDWYAATPKDYRIAAVAFGQTPVSYDSALIGVAHSTTLSRLELVDTCRSLGAPILLEIDRDEVREWGVSRKRGGHGLIGSHALDRISDLFVGRAQDWKRESLYRAKNIGTFHWAPQLSLFAGLLPDLEDHIQDSLDPLLRDTLWATKSAFIDSAGRDPDPAQLFKLVFWLLTAKVFRDRGVPGFAHFISPNEDELLVAVAKQYGLGSVPRLLNRDAREAATLRIWRDLDFRNLSVDVLSQIWATTLVDDDTRKRLGIHRTPRTVVRYMVGRIPFDSTGDDDRIVLEPCSGSSVFLIGAMNALRQNQLYGMPPAERHAYFIGHLAGIESEPFGVEISRLALTLADFPNPGGWVIKPGDVFDGKSLAAYARRAGVVLCNPPFETFEMDEREDYQTSSPLKPAELLKRVLDDLHPRGVLGFVLPRRFMAGRGYAKVRRLLADRFAKIELTLLPDRVFEADPEVVLLIATDPVPHYTCQVTNRRVNDDAASWQRFELSHEVSSEAAEDLDLDQAAKSFQIPELPNVWRHLINFPTLGDVSVLHRGIEWNQPLTDDGEETGNRNTLVRLTHAEGYRRGVAPRTKFKVFEQPELPYLSLRPSHKRTNAYLLPWHKPKAILNKSTKSRGRWRMAAFPDSEGVTCYQTFIGVWPKTDKIDEWTLAAVLNSPVANAYVSTREGKVDITKKTLNEIPFPVLSRQQSEKLRELVQRYQRLTERQMWMQPSTFDAVQADRVLKEIDAIILDGYHMPARVEHELLEFFRGDDRPTPFKFSPYLPPGEDVYFSLSERLSPEFQQSTAGALLKRMAIS